MSEAVLEIVGLARSWNGKPALRRLDLRLEAGCTLGLIGPDGAGKTTAMRIACGLLRPDAGRATVLGRDSTLETAAIKDSIGYMPQRFSLYPDLTVDENLRFFADLHGIGRAEFRPRREKLLGFARLEPFVGRRAGALSGGMKQKLALACTLIHQPRLLVLDEPTTGVDPVSRREFWALLKTLAADGMALWTSTPYMDEAERCDEVLLLHEGRLIARGAPAAVAASFSRRMLALRGVAAPGCRAALEALPGVEVRRFGDVLRVIYADPALEPRIIACTARAGVEAAPCQPGIEDAFFELVERAEAGTAAEAER